MGLIGYLRWIETMLMLFYAIPLSPPVTNERSSLAKREKRIRMARVLLSNFDGFMSSPI